MEPNPALVRNVEQMDVERLMRRFREGDPDAVRDLYELYGRAVFAIATRALRDRGLAEEAVQLTFLQAWRAASRFEGDRDPRPWLYTITRRVCVDLYRRERRHVTSVGDDEPEVVVLPVSFESLWETWQVRLALDELSDPEREVLAATHYLGLTQQEAARKLDIPIGTVKSRMHRAHRKLAGLLTHVREETA